jgi:hypothetical protein
MMTRWRGYIITSKNLGQQAADELGNIMMIRKTKVNCLSNHFVGEKRDHIMPSLTKGMEHSYLVDIRRSMCTLFLMQNTIYNAKPV